MSKTRASEITDEQIQRLISEKTKLNQRIKNLIKENNRNTRDLNTRTQNYYQAQIDGTQVRLNEISEELKQLYSEFSKPIPIRSRKSGTIDTPHKFSGLENFINLSIEKMTLRTPMGKNSGPVDNSQEHTDENNDLITGETVSQAEVIASQSGPIQTGNLTSSTPNRTSDDLPILPTSEIDRTPINLRDVRTQTTNVLTTTMFSGRPNKNRFDLPPNYESAEDRAIR